MSRNLFTRSAGPSITALTIMVLAACGGNSTTGGAPSPGGTVRQRVPVAYAGNPASADCLLGANGVDVEVGIADPTTSCASWIQKLAGTGLVWYPISQLTPPGSAGSADQETMAQACDLTDGAQELYVEDAGGQDYGDSICSHAERNGWAPAASPGPLAVQAQQQAQQLAQAAASAAAAQASASAAAAQAQAISQAQQSVSDDISTLESDSGTLNTDKSLGGDITTMSSDYGTEQSDWKTEQSDSCSNLSDDASTVSDDGSNVSDDLSSLQDDITSLQQGDIQSVQSDLSTLQSDLTTLHSLGAAPAQDPAAAIAGGDQALKNAGGAITWATQNGDAINSQAQALATTAQNYAIAHGC